MNKYVMKKCSRKIEKCSTTWTVKRSRPGDVMAVTGRRDG